MVLALYSYVDMTYTLSFTLMIAIPMAHFISGCAQGEPRTLKCYFLYVCLSACLSVKNARSTLHVLLNAIQPVAVDV